MTSFLTMRQNMVDCQIKTNGVTSPSILAAFLAVKREIFTSNPTLAYSDIDIDIGNLRYLTEPRALARMLQALAITKSDKLLIIGSATGYNVAIAAHLTDFITAIESDDELYQKSLENLKGLAKNINNSELTTGFAANAPYDAILIDGAVGKIPNIILEQLAINGRLVTIIQRPGSNGKAIHIQKAATGFIDNKLFDASTPILPGFALPPKFIFN